jgi:hypothetical protein
MRRMTPSIIDRVNIVAVVVPSPATSFVLLAASLISSAPMRMAGSFNRIDLLTVTPSFVTIGAWSVSRLIRTVRPNGPIVDPTAFAAITIPSYSFFLAAPEKTTDVNVRLFSFMMMIRS